MEARGSPPASWTCSSTPTLNTRSKAAAGERELHGLPGVASPVLEELFAGEIGRWALERVPDGAHGVPDKKEGEVAIAAAPVQSHRARPQIPASGLEGPAVLTERGEALPLQDMALEAGLADLLVERRVTHERQTAVSSPVPQSRSASSRFTISRLGAAPTIRSFSAPSLKKMSCGIAWTPKRPASPGCSSTLTLPIVT